MKSMLRLMVISTLLPAIVACHASSDDHAGSAMELKVYTVQPAQVNSVSESLHNVLGEKASVQGELDGKVLVYAPRDAQASIESAINSLDKSPVPEVAHVDVHLWIVDAMPGPGTDDPVLKELSGAFASLRKSIGPMHFQLDQAVSTRITHFGSINTTSNKGALRNIQFTTGAVHGDNVGLSIQYDEREQNPSAHAAASINGLMTTINAPSGQYVVLAQVSGENSDAKPGETVSSASAASPLRLLVVRVDRIQPTN